MNGACAVYGNCQKVSSRNTLLESSSTERLLKLTKRWSGISSLSFMNPKLYAWCSFERWHGQACFCFLWLCRVCKLMLFNSTLMYLSSLKRANWRKDIERNTRNWCWIEWESLPPNKKVNTFFEDRSERSHWQARRHLTTIANVCLCPRKALLSRLWGIFILKVYSTERPRSTCELAASSNKFIIP